MSEQAPERRVTIPVRSGRFAYVCVAPHGAARDLLVDATTREQGWFTTTVDDGDRILEIALGSTSDPDLDRARGQVWPVENEP